MGIFCTLFNEFLALISDVYISLFCSVDEHFKQFMEMFEWAAVVVLSDS